MKAMEGDPDAGMVSSDPAAPRFLSFGTNVATLTHGESVTFSAVVTDPDGIDDLIGGTLQTADGSATYGALVSSGQEGAYSITLSWGQIQQTGAISFQDHADRMFVAKFYDTAGHEAQQAVSVELTCHGGYACQGTCVKRNVCSYQSGTRRTCDDTCAIVGMTCDPTVNQWAMYGTYPLAISCDDLPSEELLDGAQFTKVDCGCKPTI